MGCVEYAASCSSNYEHRRYAALVVGMCGMKLTKCADSVLYLHIIYHEFNYLYNGKKTSKQVGSSGNTFDLLSAGAWLKS